MKVRITADSTCDLSPELLRKYDIALAPLSVIIDGEVFHDGVDVTPRDVFRAADAGKSVRTAAVNAYEYKEFFGKQLRNCDQLVHICISSEFSTCYADACEAAAETGNVFVVDSRNLSTGSGLLALEGVEMAEKGMDGEAVAEALRGKTGLVDTSFVVRTIDYLRRGGRCNKYRGRYEHYLKHYIQDALADDRMIDFRRVFITHSPSEEGLVRFAIDTVKSYGLFQEVLETMAGCTVCTHCGPDTLGIIFMRKQ